MKTIYIFLDIDGVINCYSNKSKHIGLRFWFKQQHDLAMLDSKPLTTMLKLLDHIHSHFWNSCDCDIKVVISSNWRLFLTKDDFAAVANNCALFKPIWDLVPQNWCTHDSSYRGVQINDYIKDNNVKNYIILDDVHDQFLPYQMDNLVKVNGITGLRDSDFARVDAILAKFDD